MVLQEEALRRQREEAQHRREEEERQAQEEALRRGEERRREDEERKQRDELLRKQVSAGELCPGSGPSAPVVSHRGSTASVIWIRSFNGVLVSALAPPTGRSGHPPPT